MPEPSILTGLRLPPDLDAQLRRVAARYGVSRNALIRIVLAGYAASASPALLTPDQVATIDRAVELARGENP
jgi:hypothetical protein